MTLMMIPLLRLLLVVLLGPVSSPLSIVRINMARAIGLVVRAITVSVRRWRETTCVVRCVSTCPGHVVHVVQGQHVAHCRVQ